MQREQEDLALVQQFLWSSSITLQLRPPSMWHLVLSHPESKTGMKVWGEDQLAAEQTSSTETSLKRAQEPTWSGQAHCQAHTQKAVLYDSISTPTDCNGWKWALRPVQDPTEESLASKYDSFLKTSFKKPTTEGCESGDVPWKPTWQVETLSSLNFYLYLTHYQFLFLRGQVHRSQIFGQGCHIRLSGSLSSTAWIVANHIHLGQQEEIRITDSSCCRTQSSSMVCISTISRNASWTPGQEASLLAVIYVKYLWWICTLSQWAEATTRARLDEDIVHVWGGAGT